MDRATKRSTRIHELELKHQNALHQTTVVSKDEDARRLRLKEHLLKDDMDTLQEQLIQRDDHISKMSARYHQAVSELQAVKETVRKQDAQMKLQTRDLSHLKTELQALESVSQGSAKLLTEKLGLTRELSVLKPELEHLKSQLTHQQSVIAEKHALERQLNSLEVELEAERCSKQRAQKDEMDSDELRATIQELENKLMTEKRSNHRAIKEDKDTNDELEGRVSDLEKKLAAEKKDKDRVRKEGERALSEATAQHEVFEERLGTMKAKLREARDELKRCHAELAEARSSSIVSADVSERTVTLPAARKQLKKRRPEEATEVTMPTPHAEEHKVKRAFKKRGLDFAGVGEKSTFSITPFLNRTKALDDSTEDVEADESYVPEPKGVGPNPVGAEEPSLSDVDAEAEAAPEPTVKPAKVRGRPRKVLGEMSMPNATKHPRAKIDGRTKAPKQDSIEGKVDEEAVQDAENVAPNPATEKEEVATEKAMPAKKAPIRKLKPSAKQSAEDATAAAAAAAAELEPKKKKRKLLGGPNRTLFDDDEGDVPAKPLPTSRVALGGARKLGAAGALGVKRDAFAGKAFSPLKKDRRGVHASFLA